MEKYFYFDTNVFNKLAYVPNNDFIFKRMKEFKHYVCISEVTIFEILRDRKDLYNIDKIISMIQNMDNIVILPSLSNIIISYVMKKKNYIKNDNSLIEEVLEDKNKIFIIENDEYLLNGYKKICKELKKYIKELYNNEECNKCKQYFCDKNIIEITKIFIIIFLICDFKLLEASYVEKFWRLNDIDNLQDKINYINNNIDYLIDENSPFRNMARIYALQINNYSNGTLNDCFHCMYNGMVDYIVSDDKNFTTFFSNGISFEKYLKSINVSINWENNPINS